MTSGVATTCYYEAAADDERGGFYTAYIKKIRVPRAQNLGRDDKSRDPRCSHGCIHTGKIVHILYCCTCCKTHNLRNRKFHSTCACALCAWKTFLFDRV